MSVLSLTNFTGGEISPLLSGRTDMVTYSSSCASMENFIPRIHGPASRRSGFKYVGACKYSESASANDNKNVRLIPFSYSADNSYILEMGDSYFRVITENGFVVSSNGQKVGAATPYSESELFEISFAQAGKNLYLAHKNHEPRIITVKDGSWTCEKLRYTSIGIVPTMQVAQIMQFGDSSKQLPLVRKVAYAVAAVDEKGRETAMSTALAPINAPAKCDYENYINVSWTNYLLGNEFLVYQIVNDIPSYIGRSKKSSFNDMGLLEGDYTKLPRKHIHSFTEKSNYPSKVAFFDGRLIFAASDNEPNSVWGSVVGDYSYFAAMDAPTDSCSWKFTLDSGRVNKIMWLLPTSKLLIGTAGDEWRMSGNGGGTITPNSVEARRETAWGSADTRALSAGQEIVFVDRSGKNVRTFRYANESAGYYSSNLSLYAEHMTRNTSIKDWDYAPAPHSAIWIVTEDGKLLGLTYDQDQKVAAWHRHSTEGLFESVAVMSDKGRDRLFAVVKRNIDGKDVKYIETMEADFMGNETKKADDAFFVDSGLKYSGAPARNISGLGHLKGETVSICADGAVHPMRKVSESGAITLDYPARTVSVGLQYSSILETMPVESMLTDGVSQSRVKRISEISVRLENTVGLLVGTNKNDLVRVPFRDSSVPMNSAPKLFTGDKKITVKSGYDASSSVVVMQDQPMPMTVVAIFPRVRYAGR